MTTVDDVLAGRARCCVVDGDAAEVLARLPDACAHAVVTDPPSGIAFMGAEWDRDKGGRAQWVAWLAGILADARRCTRDGGRSVVWSLPRTSHWTGCAVEDAGWSIENTVTHLYGTGWPKGSSQLKPAAETWWLARNGRSEPLNIDACRVGSGCTRRTNSAEVGFGGGNLADTYETGSDAGRWPSNVVLSHAPGCVRVGARKVRSDSAGYCGAKGVAGGLQSPGSGWGTKNTGEAVGYADADGQEEVEAWECVPEGCPVAELDAQAGARPGLLAGSSLRRGATTGAGLGYGSTATTQTVTAGYDSGGEANASRFFPCFPADPAVFRYVAKPSSAEKGEGAEANAHPTVKSIALMRWLIDLVTQRDDLVIDPFGGSGTTGCAALASGRRVILIERDPRYAEIARQRCAHWGAEWSAPARASKRRAKRDADEGPQPSLFDLAGGAK